MNNQERAKFWVDIICDKGGYSKPEELKEQFNSSKFSEFCDCGCNSFKVEVDKKENIKPIAKTGKYGAIFECNFNLEEDNKTLEIVLFADKDGYLAYVEVDCCANSYPVPEVIKIKGEPFHVKEF